MKKRSSRSRARGKRSRRRTRPSATAYQQQPRAIVAAVATNWRYLRPACRPTWQVLADQLPANPHPYNLYNSVNATLRTLGHPAVEVAPELPVFGYLTPGPFTAVHLFSPPHALQLNLPVTNTRPPDDYLYQATRPLSPGISNPGTAFRLLGSAPGHSPWSAEQLTQAYLRRFGDPPDGEALWLRLTPVIRGLRGIEFTFTTLVTRAASP